jgi:hypothetical protein
VPYVRNLKSLLFFRGCIQTEYILYSHFIFYDAQSGVKQAGVFLDTPKPHFQKNKKLILSSGCLCKRNICLPLPFLYETSLGRNIVGRTDWLFAIIGCTTYRFHKRSASKVLYTIHYILSGRMENYNRHIDCNLMNTAYKPEFRTPALYHQHLLYSLCCTGCNYSTCMLEDLPYSILILYRCLKTHRICYSMITINCEHINTKSHFFFAELKDTPFSLLQIWSSNRIIKIIVAVVTLLLRVFEQQMS